MESRQRGCPRLHRGYCADMASSTSGNVSDPAVIRRVLTTPATWAVVGLSTDATRAAYGVARWLHEGLGHRVIPVHPRAVQVWGEPAYPALAQIPEGTVVAVVDCIAFTILCVIVDCVMTEATS